MKYIKHLAHRLASNIILVLSKISRIDLLSLFYYQNGIGKYQNKNLSGELFLLEKISQYYSSQKSIICFDVGANEGEYSLLLKDILPNALIYAFEPHQSSYSRLKLCQSKQLYTFPLGLGAKESTIDLYDYIDNSGSEHVSIYPDAFTLVHNTKNIIKHTCNITTIDIFCKQEGIDFIHLLKIDTEGHEIEVIRGSIGIIRNYQVDFIQFEFTQINIVSRVFLRDFYDLLKNYKIYRLDSNRLIPLFHYQVCNEIFQYQNFLAVSNKIHHSFSSIL